MSKTLKVVAAVMFMMAVAAGCTKPEAPENEGDNSGYNATVVPHNGGVNDSVTHGFVDLGLPSGTLWAICNLGANSPEEIGDYFSWGETRPKRFYSWSNYRYGDVVDDHFRMTKYCTDSCYGLNGFVDNITVLERIDDAAKVNWGMAWHTTAPKNNLHMDGAKRRGRTASDWLERQQHLPASGWFPLG